VLCNALENANVPKQITLSILTLFSLFFKILFLLISRVLRKKYAVVGPLFDIDMNEIKVVLWPKMAKNPIFTRDYQCHNLPLPKNKIRCLRAFKTLFPTIVHLKQYLK